MNKAIKSVVVVQFPWTAVKKRGTGFDAFFDMWEWNVWKMKWVRLSNTGCGFGTKADASREAKKRSDEIAAMLANNKSEPNPLS